MSELEREQIYSKIRAQRCLVCSSKSVDVCHIKSRGSGGSDDEWNLMSLCRLHHTESHQIGWLRFSKKYPNVAANLAAKGWTFNEVFGISKLHRN